MPRSILFASGAAFALGGLVAGVLTIDGPRFRTPEWAVSQASWTEIRWPFPPDPWGEGKAFRCPSSRCGTETIVTVRAKLGFCNCATGVADDDELARIGDLDLLASSPSALGSGRPVVIGWMNGRSRSFTIREDGAAPQRSMLSIGFNDRCDALVATALIDHPDPGKAEANVLGLLNGRPVLGWIELALGI